MRPQTRVRKMRRPGQHPGRKTDGTRQAYYGRPRHPAHGPHDTRTGEDIMKGKFELHITIDRDTTADTLALANMQAVFTGDPDDEDTDTGGPVIAPDGQMVGYWEAGS